MALKNPTPAGAVPVIQAERYSLLLFVLAISLGSVVGCLIELIRMLPNKIPQVPAADRRELLLERAVLALETMVRALPPTGQPLPIRFHPSVTVIQDLRKDEEIPEEADVTRDIDDGTTRRKKRR